MTTQKRTPATAMTGALEAQADKLSTRANQHTAKKQELLSRLDALEELSRWRLELQARLYRKQLIFLHADYDTDIGGLADEVETFRRVTKLLKWAQRQRP